MKGRMAIIGAGALGSVLARRLVQSGYAVEAVISRDRQAAAQLASLVGAPFRGISPDLIPDPVEVIFICVPDGAIADVAAKLAPLDHSWKNCVVAHTSGALPANRLAPLSARGACTMSFHPLQTFTPMSDPGAFENIYIALEGDHEAVKTGTKIAKDLGSHPLYLSTEAKLRYHLAASMVSNFTVTLAAIVGEIMASIEIDWETASRILRPLVDSTWQNLRQAEPGTVLSGPIVRGDTETVERHLQALYIHLPHLAPVYEQLARQTVLLAIQSRRLTPENGDAMIHCIESIAQVRCADGGNSMES